MAVLICIIIILLIPYFIDIYINGLNFIKRLKIGQWSDIDQWYKAIEKTCTKWIKKTPTVKKTDNSRLIIIDMLNGSYRNNTIQSWQMGIIYLSLAENNNHNYLSSFVKNNYWKVKPKEVDFGILAYAILKDIEYPNDIKLMMDEMYRIILDNIDESDGCVSYRKGLKEIRFVDTIGFIAPFLVLYGKTYQINNAISLAKKIIISYYQNGFEENLLLPIHAYDANTNAPLGIYGWGRGVGWFLLGIIDTYLESYDYDLKQIIFALAEKYVEYQMNNGSFGSVIHLKQSSDSSITSICAYFYAQCYIIFNDKKYLNISKKCILYLMKATRRNGEIDYSQGDTKGIGLYSITYDIMPFTQGMTLRAINILNKVGSLDE